MTRGLRLALAGLLLGGIACEGGAPVDDSGPVASWPAYGGDAGGLRYSPLTQITRENVNQLEVAWRFKTDSLGPWPEVNLESTPLMVNGRVFSTGGTRANVHALDAATGTLLWKNSEPEGARGAAEPR